MANLKTIQFLRNADLYESLDAAKSALKTKAGSCLDGSPIAGRYTVQTGATTADTEIRTILGIVANGTVSFFMNEKEIDNVLDGLDYGPIGGTDASVLTQIQQVDGKISGLTANVGTLKLTGYDEGSASGHVESTDSINAAIAKVQNQIDAANDVIEALDYNLASDDNKVVVSLNQTDGAVSGTSVNISGIKLAGYEEAAAVADVATGDTLGQALGKLQKTIHEMDKAASAEDGKVVTTVSEADGKVSETKANVKDLQLGGYSKDTTKTGAISGTDTVNDALSKLENQISANEIKNADGSITVTPANGSTDVKVHIKDGEGVIKLAGEGGGIYTDLDLVKITSGLPETVKERYQFLDSDNTQIGENIDIPKDSHIVSINYITTGEHAQNLEYVYVDVSGNTQTTYVDMSELVIEAEFASGVTATNHVVHGVVDPTSETFLTVGGDGFKLSGVQNAITSAIEALDVTDDAAVAGQYVAAIEETDGVVAVKTRANVSEAVLNNYAKGSDGTAVDATDTVNQAISKLEVQIDNAEAAAKTVVAEGTDVGDNMSIVETAGDDGHKIFTINLTDVASKDALDAEIAARKAVDGQNGQTYAANTSANYISGATDLNDADVKLDAALKASDDNIAQLRTDVNALSGKAVTEINSSDSSISAVSSSTTDGTVKYNIVTDGGKIKATGFDAFASSGTPSASDSVSTVLSKLYANAKMDAVKAGSATTVVAAANGTTVDVKLDESSALSVNNNNGNGNNALMITSDGLFLSKDWDCGTF